MENEELKTNGCHLLWALNSNTSHIFLSSFLLFPPLTSTSLLLSFTAALVSHSKICYSRFSESNISHDYCLCIVNNWHFWQALTGWILQDVFYTLLQGKRTWHLCGTWVLHYQQLDSANVQLKQILWLVRTNTLSQQTFPPIREHYYFREGRLHILMFTVWLIFTHRFGFYPFPFSNAQKFLAILILIHSLILIFHF